METSNENINKKKALGRGLGSLLSGPAAVVPPISEVPKSQPKSSVVTTQATQEAQRVVATTQTIQDVSVSGQSRVWMLPIEKLVVGKNQPRKVFEKGPLEELASSIRSHGIIQPLLVKKNLDGTFEIIAGERRWRAAQAAGLHEVPAVLKDVEEKIAAELALIENVQREDLNPIEEGRAYLKLIQEYGYTQQQVSERVGKDRATIANLVRVLSLPAGAISLVSSGDLSLGHAKVLLALAEDPIEQLRLSQMCVEKKLSVRQLEGMIKKITKDKQGDEKVVNLDQRKALGEALIASISEELQKFWGTKVNIDYRDGRGKVTLHYYSDDEFSSMIDKLKQIEKR